MKKLEVSGIQEGTVIDHIPPGKVFSVAKILKLEQSNDKVFIGANLESKKGGSKGLLKIAKKKLSKAETNKLALIAPEATVNIIKDFEVVEKRKVNLPEQVQGITVCINPNCITNQQHTETKMHVIRKIPLRLRCHYCERTMEADEIRIP